MPRPAEANEEQLRIVTVPCPERYQVVRNVEPVNRVDYWTVSEFAHGRELRVFKS
jgi:hypothetical protein